jgi:hypothetical protein
VGAHALPNRAYSLSLPFRKLWRKLLGV